jgi:hypothetical protein
MGEQIFGIYELDTAGTILYLRPHENNPPMAADRSIVGRNFFEAIEVSENAGWVRDHIKNFMSGQVSVDSFIFEGFDETAPVKTRILMTRGHETRDDALCAIVIMDIKKHIV